ncbi:hypothetical protein CTZ27_17775 [Streptomyces griseocarneus]|nr:hypothetical protein CTZ27_17775 [Streptomyces griseocarneus]
MRVPLPPGAPGMTTRRLLVRLLAALLVTTALACGALLTAYDGVSRGAPAVDGRTAPAVVAVAVAEHALGASYDDAAASIGGPTGPTEGAGEKYRAELTTANQALVKATAYGVATTEAPTLGTASAMVSSYGYLVQQAVRSARNEPLRTAYLVNARSIKDNIVERLGDVQKEQLRVRDRQVSFGRQLTLAWAGALALCAALLVLLGWSQRLLRRRFRRRFNPGLAAGTILLAAGVPTVTVFAFQMQRRLDKAGAEIGDGSGRADSGTLDHVHRVLRTARWQEGAAGWIVVTAVAIAVLVLLGLLPRIDEYRFRHRSPARTARRSLYALTGSRAHRITAAVLAAWLVALGVLVAVEQRTGQQQRITVLGPWGGKEKVHFRKVLDAFEHDNPGVEVSYQDTTALREVLLARMQTGSAPDVAVLPSRGETADYAAQHALQPLDGLLPRDYGSPWASRVNGRIYAVPVKAELKSVVWHPAATRPTPGDALDGGHWCAGMGGGDTVGWPGTDWIEDLVLQQSGTQAYERLARGDLPWDSAEMKRAWDAFGSVFTAAPAKEALRKDYGVGLLAPGATCSLEHQGTFVRNEYGGRADFLPSPGLLPGTDARSAAREVSADYAALFGRSEAARKLLRYLTTPAAQKVWAEARDGEPPDNPYRPFFPFSPSPPDIPRGEALNQHIDRELRGARTLCLDASDAMPPRLRFAFQHAVLDYLSEPTQAQRDAVLTALETVRKQSAPRQDRVCTG